MTVLFLSWTQLSSIGRQMGVGPRSSYGVEDYIIAWGEHHQKSGSHYRHAPGGINLYFEKPSDAVLFKLTWL